MQGQDFGHFSHKSTRKPHCAPRGDVPFLRHAPLPMNWTSTSLADVYHLALPIGTELVTPDANLEVAVSWACCSRPSPPAFPSLEGGELALINIEDLRVLDHTGNLAYVIRRLQEAQLSGIVMQGKIDLEARGSAIRHGMPLFAVPEDAQLAQVERDIIRLIVDRSAFVLQRATSLQRELNQIMLDGGGLEPIAERIHHVTNQPFMVLNDAGHIVTASGLVSGQATGWSKLQLQAALPNIMELRSWAVSQPIDTLTGMVRIWDLGPRFPLRACRQAAVGAVVVTDRIQGYCLLLRSESDPPVLSPIEEMAVTQGAAAVALDWVTRNAVGEAEKRMRASFLDELLGSNITDEQAWIRRGHALGYDLEAPHAAWMMEARHIPDWPLPMLEVLETLSVMALSSFRDQSLLLYCPAHADADSATRQAKQLALNVVERLGAAHPQGQIRIGIGSPVTALADWLQSQQQAWESLRANKRWGTTPVTHFEELGLYRYLTALRSFPETKDFYQSTLSTLTGFDASYEAELLETLDAFFACNGNISQTAAYLQVHRNTLTYRLNRIADITQINLEDADARFGLQLALKLRNLYH